jgi:crossover junction endodeoxyribonuclease RuvC
MSALPETEERIIMGIDPGTRVLGYGILQVVQKKVTVLQYGVLRLEKYKDLALRLKKIYDRLSSLIEEYAPDEMALESPFMGSNSQSAIKLGRAQGVAMAAALAKDLPIAEYAPKKVKQSITGNGNASKEQVAAMLSNILEIKLEQGQFLDATDALSVAVCHYYQRQNPLKKNSNWKDFINENPERVI